MSDRDPKIHRVVYRQPLPGKYRNIEVGVDYHQDDSEETRNAKLAKALKDAFYTAEETAKMAAALPVQVVPEEPAGATPTNGGTAPPPQAGGRACPTCKGPMERKTGNKHQTQDGNKQFIEVNGEMMPKMKAWAGWFCKKSGNRIPEGDRCSQTPQWEGQKG